MIHFFTDPYNDEILYSTIARYHYYSGNTSFKDTLFQIFDDVNVIPSIELSSCLNNLSSKFNHNSIYTSKYFIDNHTNFPVFIPFLSKERREDIELEMKSKNGKGIYTKIGLVAGGICRKNSLYYCPSCAEEEMKKFGEAFFHRNNQFQGVLVCSKHTCKLKPYIESKKSNSRIEFIRLKRENIDFAKEYYVSTEDTLIMISRNVDYLLNKNLRHFDQQKIHRKYSVLLNNKGYLTVNLRVNQKRLYRDFVEFYGEQILNILESNPNYSNESNWLKCITRKPKKVIHPIRHILFINFLCNDIFTFFETNLDRKLPFGDGPWLCLNPVADHYKKLVIKDLNITADYKTRKPVGTFKCDCGFVYSRKGPDANKEDKFKIGRIKEFGHVWEDKLKQLISNNEFSLRQLGRIMNCDPKTIVKYAEKIGIRNKIHSNMKMNSKKSSSNDVNMRYIREKYAEDILNFIKDYPSYDRTQIRERLKKQYAWFYRNDKEWLNKNLPVSNSKSNSFYKERVDWDKRDLVILAMLKDLYRELIDEDCSVRVTKSLMAKRIGKSAMIYHYIDKMPETKKFLESNTETVEEFQIRRVNKICKELIKRKHKLSKWEIEREAGLRPNYSKVVEDKIIKNINIFKSNMEEKCFIKEEQRNLYH